MSNFLDLNFTQQDLNDAAKDEYALIPKGEYVAEITRSEIKDFHWQNSGAVGKSLSLMFRIIEGEYAGRVVWDNPQLSNSEYDSFVKDGHKRLAQIAAACSITSLNDSTQVHDIPMTIVLAVEVSKDERYDDKNIIKKVLPLAGGAPNKFTAKPQVPSAPQTEPQNDAPAWQRNG